MDKGACKVNNRAQKHIVRVFELKTSDMAHEKTTTVDSSREQRLYFPFEAQNQEIRSLNMAPQNHERKVIKI